MILHIDMDAFFASIEQAINPRLKGRPLIVGSRNSRLHTVVCAASYEAKAQGIDSGMSSAEAFRLCPHLEFVAADQSKYIWTSEQIFEQVKQYGFAAEYASIDEFRLDIAGHLQPRDLARRIKEKIYANFNITASIGIAKNSLLAKLASKLNKPDGLFIIDEANLERALGSVAVGRLCGVGQVTEAALLGLGVKTCLDLYQKSPGFLRRFFGKNGLNFYRDLHQDEVFSSQDIPSQPRSISHSYTLSRAKQNTGFIQAWIRLLSEMVCRRLRQQGLVSRSVHLWLNGPDFGNFRAQASFSQETNDGSEVFRRAIKIMAKSGLSGLKIRALGITCSQLSSQNQQSLLIEVKRREALLKALDQINNRFGEGAVVPAQTFQARQ